jgi:hypothetical protein
VLVGYACWVQGEASLNFYFPIYSKAPAWIRINGIVSAIENFFGIHTALVSLVKSVQKKQRFNWQNDYSAE